FGKILGEFSKLDTAAWLKEMDVMNLSEAFIEPPVDMISFLRSFNKFLIDVVEIPEKVIEACEATEEELLKTLDFQFQAFGRKDTTLIWFF
ncbi:MAG: hypothetical protein ACXAAH_09730, partial [Promethearchaeota archaeon]